MKALPFFSYDAQCYACDGAAVGYAEHGGKLKQACERHADPRIKVFEACIYCKGPVRKGSLDTGIGFAHRSCYEEDLAQS